MLCQFFKSLFDSRYIPKNNNKIENISLEEFYSTDKLQLKELFSNQKYMVINIWASWCIPCRQEHGYIKNISEITNLKLLVLIIKIKKKCKKFWITNPTI